ncbi:MAG: hypothetical protein A2046_10930 [Bacteroidetes bacterium GWA2_30_7]|nr:MAG: hypothetical protein A2046_10930 [Bacteroidetes bacterium GWA2_30_7]
MNNIKKNILRLILKGLCLWAFTFKPRAWNLRLGIWGLMLGTLNSLQAQDPQFSQFYAAPLYLCPSYAGASDGSRVTINFRDQWPKIPGAFITYAFSADQYIRKLKSGIGFLFLRDQAGIGKLSTTNVGWQYSYNLRLNNRWYARPGIHFLYTQRSVDYTRNTFVDQISINGNAPTTVENIANTKSGFLGASSSLVFYSRKYWFGSSLDHLIKSNQSFMGVQSNLPAKYTAFGGLKVDINKRLGRFNEESATILVLYQRQRKFNQLTFSAYWLKSPLIIGIGYRGIPLYKDPKTGYNNIDAAIFLLGYRTLNFAIGYSYDFTVSRLLGSTGGAHEVSIIYEFWQGPKLKTNRKQNVVSCPKF